MVNPNYGVDQMCLWEEFSRAQHYMSYELHVEHVALRFPQLPCQDQDILALMRWQYYDET